ncbi:hypothetical protein AB1H94_17165 [Pseudomonas fulva]|uniref:hypothetical protein n=1 Tax=Pseudomonas fulva TaxID=47880 RepID=UPI00345DBF32
MTIEILKACIPYALLLIACMAIRVADRRRKAYYGDARRRFRDRREQVERDARKRL